MGGLLWDGATQVGVDSLNSPIVFDARVSASASATSGGTYQTVAAALAAGRRSIFVEAADYAAGFTVTQNNVLIFCAVPPGYDGGFAACTFGGPIRVSANFVKIVNAHSVGVTGYGFTADCGYYGVRFIDCTAYQSSLHGFYLAGHGGAVAAGSFDCECRGCVANDCGGTLYDGFHVWDIDYDLEWLLDGCRSFANGRDGFAVCVNATAATVANNRTVTLRDCTAVQNTAHGIRVGGRASIVVEGGRCYLNGGSGIYMLTQETSLARSQVIGARVRSNTTAGVQLQAVSSSHVLLGVQAYSNGANFINCGSTLGFSTCNNGV